ncbi:hypothetical protein BJ912DRAFT_610640 [Pholiota molesta]|nr:hypothetical protein BJ912DRAFT_610640 [Pholiota molesta]
MHPRTPTHPAASASYAPRPRLSTAPRAPRDRALAHGEQRHRRDGREPRAPEQLRGDERRADHLRYAPDGRRRRRVRDGRQARCGRGAAQRPTADDVSWGGGGGGRRCCCCCCDRVFADAGDGAEEAESNSRVGCRRYCQEKKREKLEKQQHGEVPRETPTEAQGGKREDPPAAEASAFAAHVAHVAGAAASGVAHALALAPGEAGGAGSGGGGAAHQWDSSGALAAESVSLLFRGGRLIGGCGDRLSDKDKDRHGAAFAPRVLVGEGGAYPVYGERVGPAGAEDERETYSGTATPTHTYTPPQIFQPLQESPQPPRLVVVNPTPNLTPHPTPPSTPIAFAGLPGRLFRVPASS